MVKTDYCDFRRIYDSVDRPNALQKKFYSTIKRYWSQNKRVTNKISHRNFDNFYNQNVHIDRLIFDGTKPLTSNGEYGIIYKTHYLPWAKQWKGRLTRKKYEQLTAKRTYESKFKNGILTSVFSKFEKVNHRELPIFKPVPLSDVVPGLNKVKRGEKIENAFILLAVFNYHGEGTHENHGVSAFMHKKTLFCFNAHGEASRPSDINIWYHLKNIYKCNKVVVYNGWNFQSIERNTQGACVGYAVNFGSLMYRYILMKHVFGEKVPGIPTNRQKFNEFVFNLFKNSKGVFGQIYNVANPSKSSKTIFHNLTHQKRVLQSKRYINDANKLASNLSKLTLKNTRQNKGASKTKRQLDNDIFKIRNNKLKKIKRTKSRINYMNVNRVPPTRNFRNNMNTN